MQDLSLNQNFSVHLDDRNDLAKVDGHDAFEQEVVVMLTDFMHETLPGLTGNKATIKERIRLEVSRVARKNENLDGINQIGIEKKTAGRYQVTIDYIAADSFVFEVQE